MTIINAVSNQALTTTSTPSFTNVIPASASTATAATTTTLTATSAQQQYFTGTTTQICLLPVTSGLALGFYFLIYNNSTGNVTVNASDSSLVVVLTPNTSLKVTCISTSVTTNAAWDVQYLLNSLAPTQANSNIVITGGSATVSPQFSLSYTSGIINNVFYPTLLNASFGSLGVLGPTGINFGNIQWLNQSMNMSSVNLTSISCPSLITILGTINLNTPNLTTFTAPNLICISSLVLTNTNLTTFSLPALVNLTGTGITITASASLTTLNLPLLNQSLGNFSATLPALTTLTLTNLISIGDTSAIAVAGSYSITANALTTLSMPALTAIATNFAPVGTLLATVNMPALITVGGTFSPTLAALTSLTLTSLTTVTGAFGLTAATLTTLAMPALTTLGAGFAPVCASATTVTLTLLSSITGTVAASFASLVTLSLPALTVVTSTFTITAANMTTFSMNSGLLKIGGNFTMTGMKLTQSSVDGILASLAALNGSGGTTAYSSLTVNLSGGTSSTPSAAGLTSKATLVARGCTVTTN